MAVRWERGFRRITILFSVALLIVGLGWSGLYGLNERPGWLMYFGSVLLALAIAGLPWVMFLIGRWLAQGFRNDAM